MKDIRLIHENERFILLAADLNSTFIRNLLQLTDYKIKILDVYDTEHSESYNPLLYVNNESDGLELIDCFFENTTERNREGRSDNDIYCYKHTNTILECLLAEKYLCAAVLFYLLFYCNDESKKNMTNMLLMLDSNTNDSLKLIFEELPDDSLGYKYFKKYEQVIENKTLQTMIIVSLCARLSPFACPQFNKITTEDTLNLNEITEENTILVINESSIYNDPTFIFLYELLKIQVKTRIV